MRTLSQTFGAAGIWPLQIAGRYLRIIDAPNSVDVDFFDAGGKMIAEAQAVGAGYYAMPAGGFARVDIITGSAQTIKIALSDGEGGYDVVAVVGSVNATIINSPTVSLGQGAFTSVQGTVTNASTTLKAANAARKYLAIQNNDAAGIIYVNLAGATATALNGLKIMPGGSFVCDGYCPSGAITAIGSIASNANVVVVEG